MYGCNILYSTSPNILQYQYWLEHVVGEKRSRFILSYVWYPCFFILILLFISTHMCKVFTSSSHFFIFLYLFILIFSILSFIIKKSIFSKLFKFVWNFCRNLFLIISQFSLFQILSFIQNKDLLWKIYFIHKLYFNKKKYLITK